MQNKNYLNVRLNLFVLVFRLPSQWWWVKPWFMASDFLKEKKSLYEFIALSSRFYSPQSQTEERKQKNELLRCRITFFGSSERLRFIYFFFHSGQWKTTMGLFVQRVCRLLSWNRMANIFFSLLPFRPEVCMIKWLCRYS